MEKEYKPNPEINKEDEELAQDLKDIAERMEKAAEAPIDLSDEEKAKKKKADSIRKSASW